MGRLVCSHRRKLVGVACVLVREGNSNSGDDGLDCFGTLRSKGMMFVVLGGLEGCVGGR